MYEHILNNVLEKLQSLGFKPQLPATPDSINKLQNEAKEKFSTNIPDEYIDFLSKMNGLNWGGLTLLASEQGYNINVPDRIFSGLINKNIDLRGIYGEKFNNLLVLGISSTSIYAYNIINNSYHVYDSASGGDLLENFQSFSDMMIDALEGCL